MCYNLAMLNPQEKLKSDVDNFFEVYKVLNAEGRAAFETQMGPLLNSSDPQTKALYHSLLRSAKDGLSPDEAIARLVQDGKTNEAGEDQDKP